MLALADPAVKFSYSPSSVLRPPQDETEIDSGAGWPVATVIGGLITAVFGDRKHKRQMTDSKLKSGKKLLASGMPPRDAASSLSVSVPTLYRWIPVPAQA
jgi:hypothetical protein